VVKAKCTETHLLRLHLRQAVPKDMEARLHPRHHLLAALIHHPPELMLRMAT
tara:strand:- start:1514 stop:1669 length:156 start_codon:yes stop_codon:yes gene_type:complete